MRNEHGARVFCGRYHSFILKKDNSLFGFGDCRYGQLSLPKKDHYLTPTFVMKDEKIFNITGGTYVSFLLMRDGSLFVCGKNDFNQLGVKKVGNVFKFEFVMGEVKQVFAQNHFNAVLKKNGQVFILGKFECNQLSGKEGDLQRQLQVGEPVKLLMGNDSIKTEWKFECHKEFDEEFQESVFCFLLCMKRNVPTHLKLPKPIFSIVINLTI